MAESSSTTTKFCLQTCLPNPFLSENEPENHLTTTSVSASRRFFATTTATSFFPTTQFTNHESLPSIEEAYAQFIDSYPNYSDTYKIDEIRAQEYYHLSLSNHVCLDYIGIGLFSFSQLHNQLYITYPTEASSSSMAPQDSPQISDLPLFTLSYRSVNLKSELISNSCHESTTLESAIKRRVRDFLKISEDDYSLVFTANRTSAFKLLAESYPFQSHKKLLSVYDHDNEAVDAMISSSSKRGAKVMEAEFAWPRLRICSTKLKNLLESGKSKRKRKGLFIFQLQSRLTGARYSYQWMKIAQENNWHVLLDACALGPKDMDSLGLSLLQPDFLVCSFYKVFGENPSGFGCLFVKKSVLPILDDSTIVGIASITSGNRFLSPPPDVPNEHTTEINQLTIQSSDTFTGSVSALIPPSGLLELGKDPGGISTNSCNTEKDDPSHEITETESTTSDSPSDPKNSSTKIEFRCLDHVDSLGLTLINTRRRYLTNWLIHALLKLHHPSSGPGIPLVRIYGPKVKFDRGPALAFNVFDWKGQKVEPPLVQKLGDRRNISLSTGFLQNIWFSEKYQVDNNRVLEKKGAAGSSFGMMNGGVSGSKGKGERGEVGVKVVTAAIGYLANFEDAYRLWAFVSQFLDADFVEKERWRYRTLDQTTLEI